MLGLKAHAHAACTIAKDAHTHSEPGVAKIKQTQKAHVSAADRMHYLHITSLLLALNNQYIIFASLSRQNTSISLLNSQVKAQSVKISPQHPMLLLTHWTVNTQRAHSVTPYCTSKCS
jgi:hypothetical protein